MFFSKRAFNVSSRSPRSVVFRLVDFFPKLSSLLTGRSFGQVPSHDDPCLAIIRVSGNDFETHLLVGLYRYDVSRGDFCNAQIEGSPNRSPELTVKTSHKPLAAILPVHAHLPADNVAIFRKRLSSVRASAELLEHWREARHFPLKRKR